MPSATSSVLCATGSVTPASSAALCTERSGGYDLLTEHCPRMDVRRPPSLPDVDGSRGEIDALHPPEIVVVSARGAEPVTVIQRRLLRREAIPMHGHLLSLRRLRQLALELEPGQCLALVEQLVQRQLAQAEVLPPRALLLATEVAEHLRQQPSRVLGAVACARVLRHADEQRLRRCPDAPVALPDRFLRLGTRRLRPREGERRLAAARLEPVAQRARRETVLAVVG